MLQREGYTDTFVTDIPFSRIAAFKQAIHEHRSPEVYGIGADAGELAMFGSPSRFSGREVTGYSMSGGGTMPYDMNPIKGGRVDWHHTELPAKVPLQEIDPRGLVSTQALVTSGGLHHYLRDTTGQLYDRRYSPSNENPVIFEDEDTGQRQIMTGHHRSTAALLMGKPIIGRLVRGQTLKRV